MSEPTGGIEYHEYQWAYSIMDSSRVSTFLISMLLIVYGSFRSLNMEQEARERQERERQQNASSLTGLLANAAQQNSQPDNNVQTLDTMQALCLPLGASVSLLVMFFFFDSMQMLFAICTASKWQIISLLYYINQTKTLVIITRGALFRKKKKWSSSLPMPLACQY